MRCPLYRPLNAPVLSLMTELGERLFLLDTGCPISFASEARELMAGAWFERSLPLKRPPFSLLPLRERLGLPIEGFIGLGELVQHGDALLDFDEGALILGEEARQEARRRVEAEEAHVITSLSPERRSPIKLTVLLDQEERSCYLDTGSRFVVAKAQQPLTRSPQAPLYSLGLVSPVGHVEVQVSAGHCVQLEGHRAAEVCVATGAPPQHPNILGMEWLSRFNVLLSFHNQTALLFPRDVTPQRWERFTGDQHSPPIELSFPQLDYQRAGRPFYVLPRVGDPLPEGLTPFTPYQLKGHSLPAGVEGVNELMNALICEEPTPVTLVGPDGEVSVTRAPLFKGR